MNQFSSILRCLRVALGAAIVTLGWTTSLSAQSVRTTHCGDKVTRTVNPVALEQELQTLWDSINGVGGVLGNLNWSDVLSNGGNPEADVNFSGYSVNGINELFADSISGTGTLSIDGVATLSDSTSILGQLAVSNDYGQLVVGASPFHSLYGLTLSSMGILSRSISTVADQLYDLDLSHLRKIELVGTANDIITMSPSEYEDYIDGLGLGTNENALPYYSRVGGEFSVGTVSTSPEGAAEGEDVSSTSLSWANDSMIFISNHAILDADTVSIWGRLQAGTSLMDSLVVTDVINGQVDNLDNHTTDGLTEGATNLYYTDARAQAAMTAGTGVTLNAGEISIGQDVSTTSDVTFDELFADSAQMTSQLTAPKLLSDSLQNLSGSNLDIRAESDLTFGGVNLSGEFESEYYITLSDPESTNGDGVDLFGETRPGFSNTYMATYSNDVWNEKGLQSQQASGYAKNYSIMDNWGGDFGFFSTTNEDLVKFDVSQHVQKIKMEPWGNSDLGSLLSQEMRIDSLGEVKFEQFVFTGGAITGDTAAGLFIRRNDFESPFSFRIENQEGDLDLTANEIHFNGDAIVSGVLTADSLSVTDVISGQIDNLDNHTTDGLTEGTTNLYFTESRARQAISVTDNGGAGSLTYNSSTGVIAYDGPDSAAIRGHFTAGEGIAINAGEIAVHGDLLARIDSLEAVISSLSSSSSSSAFRCGQTYSYNGYDYTTTRIGSACWFSENLRTEQLADGTEIAVLTDGTNWSSSSSSSTAIAPGDGSDEVKGAFGLLYNFEVVQTDAVCPSGWHVPTSDEFDNMFVTLGLDLSSEAATASTFPGVLEATKAAQCDWPSWNGSNACGLSLTPGGHVGNDGGAMGFESNATYWSTTEPFSVTSENTMDGSLNTTIGAAIRCVKDDGTPSVVETIAASNVQETTTTIQGRVRVPYGTTMTGSGLIWGGSADLTSATTEDLTAVQDTVELNLTGLTAGTTYHYVAFASTNGGTVYGDTLSFTTSITPAVFATCGDEIYFNGYNYETVSADGRCWFAENLQTLKYRDGSDISVGISGSENAAAVEWLDRGGPDASSNVAQYGRFYNWYATQQEICPTNWSVPTEGEFTSLVTTFGGNGDFGDPSAPGAKTALLDATEGGTNSSGLSMIGVPALPVHEVSTDTLYQWWNSSVPANITAMPSYLLIYENYNYVSATVTDSRTTPLSIRCIMDLD